MGSPATWRDSTPVARSPIAAPIPPLKPPLKWAGGKRWLVPHLHPSWLPHRHRRLVEPFCGGLAVTLGLLPARAWVNDVNPSLMHFYRWLQRGLTIAIPMENDEPQYYQCRDRFNALTCAGEEDSQEAASLFYYLNRTGYNGLCRFNRRGGFNVPFGRYATIRYTRDFHDYQEPFADWTFTCQPFCALALDDDDFVYADPPYDVAFTQYAQYGFTWEDQVRTAEWLAHHPGPVMLSNQATPRIVELYTRLGFRLTFLSAPRRINWTGARTPATEVLALKNV